MADYKLTDEHPNGEPDERQRTQPQHEIYIDENAQHGYQGDAGGVEAARANLKYNRIIDMFLISANIIIGIYQRSFSCKLNHVSFLRTSWSHTSFLR